MARTVGIPAAIGAELVLQGGVGTGLVLPLGKQVYEPVLRGMAEAGIRFMECADVCPRPVSRLNLRNK
jgi:hypothetical protein